MQIFKVLKAQLSATPTTVLVDGPQSNASTSEQASETNSGAIDINAEEQAVVGKPANAGKYRGFGFLTFLSYS
jgi:hypothetical protein